MRHVFSILVILKRFFHELPCCVVIMWRERFEPCWICLIFRFCTYLTKVVKVQVAIWLHWWMICVLVAVILNFNKALGSPWEWMDASAPFHGLEEFIQGETLESRLWQSCIATLIWVGDFLQQVLTWLVNRFSTRHISGIVSGFNLFLWSHQHCFHELHFALYFTLTGAHAVTNGIQS